jgi:hypothetical protein
MATFNFFKFACEAILSSEGNKAAAPAMAVYCKNALRDSVFFIWHYFTKAIEYC